MGLTGKYDLPGIRKAGKVVLGTLLAGTAWGAWLLASPFRPLIEQLEGLFSEYLANKGLLIIDLGVAFVEGELDQSKFDKAMDSALESVKIPGLSPEEKKAIDEKVIAAFRDFARVTRRN